MTSAAASLYRETPLPSWLRDDLVCSWIGCVGPEGAPPADRVLPDGCVDLVWDGHRLIAAGPDETDSRWRTLFSDEEIEAHLRAVVAEQEEDGGWPLRWEPPSDAARCEWRGFETLQAIRVLVAYGRASP